MLAYFNIAQVKKTIMAGGWSPTGGYGSSGYSTGTGASTTTSSTSGGGGSTQASRKAHKIKSPPVQQVKTAYKIGLLKARSAGGPAGAEQPVEKPPDEIAVTVETRKPAPKRPQAMSRTEAEQAYESYKRGFGARGGVFAPGEAEREDIIQRFMKMGPQYEEEEEEAPRVPVGERVITVLPTTVGFRVEEGEPTEIDVGTYEVAITPTSIREVQDIDEALGIEDAEDYTRFTLPGEGLIYDVEETALTLMEEDPSYKITSREGTQIILEKGIVGTQTEAVVITTVPQIMGAQEEQAPGLRVDLPGMVQPLDVDLPGLREPPEEFKEIARAHASIVAMPFAFPEQARVSARHYLDPRDPVTRAVQSTGLPEYEQEYLGDFLRMSRGMREVPIIKEFIAGGEGAAEIAAQIGPVTPLGRVYHAITGRTYGEDLYRGVTEMAIMPATIAAPALWFTGKKALYEIQHVPAEERRQQAWRAMGTAGAVGVGAAVLYGTALTQRPVRTVLGTAAAALVLAPTIVITAGMYGAAGMSAGKGVDWAKMKYAKWEVGTLRAVEAPAPIAMAQYGRPITELTVKVGGQKLPISLHAPVGGYSPTVSGAGLAAESGGVYATARFTYGVGKGISVYAPPYVPGGKMGLQYVMGATKTPYYTPMGMYTDVGTVSGTLLITPRGGPTVPVYTSGVTFGTEVKPVQISYAVPAHPPHVGEIGGRITGAPMANIGGGRVTYMLPDLGLKAGEKYVTGYTYSMGVTAPYTQVVSAWPSTTAQFVRATDLVKTGGVTLRDYATTWVYPKGVALPASVAGPTAVIPGTYLTENVLATIMPKGTTVGGVFTAGGGGTVQLTQLATKQIVGGGLDAATGAAMRQAASQYILSQVRPVSGVMGTSGAVAGGVGATMAITIPYMKVQSDVRLMATPTLTAPTYGEREIGVMVERTRGETRLRSILDVETAWQPVEGVVAVPRMRQVIGPGAIQRPQMLEIAVPLIRPIERVVSRPIVAEVQVPMLTTIQRQAVEQRVAIRIRPEIGGGYFSFPELPGVPVPPTGGWLPGLPPLGSGMRGFGFRRDRGREYGHTPTLGAILGGVYGTPAKIQTGMGLRVMKRGRSPLFGGRGLFSGGRIKIPNVGRLF